MIMVTLRLPFCSLSESLKLEKCVGQIKKKIKSKKKSVYFKRLFFLCYFNDILFVKNICLKRGRKNNHVYIAVFIEFMLI